jgi:phage terminase large subunit
MAQKLKLNITKDFFNEVYLPLLDNKERWTVIMGGGGSGKSHFVTQKMILKALKYPNRKILVIRKVAGTLRESVYALFIDQLSSMGILQYCKYTTSHMKIVLPNGSEFIFMGLDDSEKIKSIAGIDDIIIEEATELTFDDFMQLNTRLRSKAKNQQIHLMYNPVSKSNWVYDFFHVKNQDNCLVLRTNYTHNKFLPKSYVDSLLSYKETNPLYYQVYAMGEFGNLGKSVFNNWKEEAFDVNELIKENDHLKTAIAMDFGFTNDPTTIMFSLADLENKKLYIVEETWQKGLLNNEIAEIIHEKGYHKQVILADSAEPKSIEEIRGLGVPKIKGVKKGAGSINQGIQFMLQFEIIIHPSCKQTIQEFRDYSYLKDKVTDQYVNGKFTGADHCIDAIRYSLTPFHKGKGVRFLDKSVFGL